MTIDVTLATVGNLIDTTTAQTTINNNNGVIVTAFESALDTSGDQMAGNLDMNSNRVLNLPLPVSANEPLRLVDANTLNGGGTIQPIPPGGTTGQSLVKISNTDYNAGWASAIIPAQAASTLLGNATTGSAAPTAFTLASLTQKTTPIAGDKLLLSDSAASGALKYVTISNVVSSGTVSSIGGLTSAVGLGPTLSTSSNNVVTHFTPITNSLASDVATTGSGTYANGPTIAQGTAGTWFVSGTITATNTSVPSRYNAKLWDGTTVIDSTSNVSFSASNPVSMSLSGFITSPAGNLRIDVADTAASTAGLILANTTGSSKDSTITAIRIA